VTEGRLPPSLGIQHVSRMTLEILDAVGDGFLTFNEILDRLSKNAKEEEPTKLQQTLRASLKILSVQSFVSTRYERPVEENEFRIREKGRELLETRTSSIKEEEAPAPLISFVLTKPPFLYSKLIEVGHTFDAFEELIDSAKEKLWIMTPYLDKYIIGAFHRNLREMFRRPNLDFRLIVSDVNQQSVAAVYTLSELAAAVGRSNITVKMFHQQEFLNDHGQWKTVRTRFSHAKLYLSESEAIITSANLNNESFVSNVEVGLHLKSPGLVAQAHRIYQVIWDNSKEFAKVLEGMRKYSTR